MLSNKYKSDPSNVRKWNDFRIQRNKVTDLRRIAIKEYFLSKCKPGAAQKEFWDAVCPFMANNTKSQRNVILKEDDRIITDTAEICDIFASFFATCADSIGEPDEIDLNDSDFLSKLLIKHSQHESILAIKEHYDIIEPFNFKPVSAEYVEKVINRLKINKSPGYDHIPPKMLKLCAKKMSVSIMELVNQAFISKVFPDDMKKTEISPIFKKLNDMCKENYRPVSVLDVYTKVVEIVVVEQLIEYFRKIFHQMLCAYRKRYGCQHVVVKLIDSWKQALDNDMFAGALLMDLSKCFDSIPHGLLIAKMKAYGLSNESCEFMASYLSGRFQRVKLSNSRSEWVPVKKGVPQGSALGPFLLNVFMNDIFHFIEICHLINYADDNTLSTVQLTIELVLSTLKKDGENAMKWFTINFMQANPNKFQFMLLKKLTSPITLPNTLEICGTEIKRDSEVKLLGVTIDDQLKFNKHVDILCKKAARQLNVMYRFKGIFDFKEKETVYNTFILANFNYCPIVWHFCGKTSTKKMELIQERALRFL